MDDESRGDRNEFNPARAVENRPYIRVEFVDPLIDPAHGGAMTLRMDVTRDEVYRDPLNLFGKLARRMIYGVAHG